MLCLAAALITFVSLSATGLIETNPIEITLIVSDESKEYRRHAANCAKLRV